MKKSPPPSLIQHGQQKSSFIHSGRNEGSESMEMDPLTSRLHRWYNYELTTPPNEALQQTKAIIPQICRGKGTSMTDILKGENRSQWQSVKESKNYTRFNTLPNFWYIKTHLQTYLSNLI